MAARLRFRGVAKWVATAFLVLLFAAWLVSVPIITNKPFGFQRWTPSSFCGLNIGTVGLVWFKESDDSPPFQTIWGWFPLGGHWPILHRLGIALPLLEWKQDHVRLALPLWLPLLLAGLTTALLWRRDRRRFPTGHCQKCGYDLTGNQSGVCSECGKPRAGEG